MRYVLDACVGLKWVLPEVDSDKAILLRDNFQNQIHDLIAPDILPTECAHTLSKKQRQGLVRDGLAFWEKVMLDMPVLSPSLPLMRQALSIATNAKIAVYDCLYVAFAEQEGCELITLDEKLIRNLQADFPFIVSLSSM